MGMQMGGGGWYRLMLSNTDNENKKVTWALVRRVMTYARPYTLQIILMFVAIIISTGLGLVGPLIIRDLIDNTLPSGNTSRLNTLAAALLIIPVIIAGLTIFQRWINDHNAQ